MVEKKRHILYNMARWGQSMKKISPNLQIVITFATVILVGTFLLMLPISSTGARFNFIDSLFMAVSAVCVTGLTVIPNIAEEVTIFGKIVLAFLIEIGGLSFITLATFFFALLGTKIGIANRFLLKEALNQSSLKGIIRLVKKIIFTSLIIQSVGIILNCFAFMPYYDGWEVIGVSFFHTIASFNNSGLDIFGSTSMIPFATDVFVNINTIILVILGGLGFVVIDDILYNKRWRRFALHTKIVLITTACLIIFGIIFLKLANHNLSFLESMFMSVSARTAGFQTINCADINSGEWVVLNFLMFVGASPGSTGGGIKTTTLFVTILVIASFVTNKRPVFAKREISQNTVIKAFSIVVTAIIFCIMAVFLVSCFNPELEVKAIVFEVISAFSTTGLSMGITTSLTIPSKLVICFMMFFGRLGPLTIISLINRNWRDTAQDKIRYIEESVNIG